MARRKKYTEEELKDTKWGKLTFRRVVEVYSTDVEWECECECGTLVKRMQRTLIRRKGSCGCDRKGTGKDSHRWKGYGDISRQYFQSVEFSAKHRNHPFGINIEYAWDLFQAQDGRCAMSGLPLTFVCTVHKRGGPNGQSASLDRKDSAVGYFPDNVQWVHKDINRMKSDLTQERFIELCRLVAAKFPAQSGPAMVEKAVANDSGGENEIVKQDIAA